MNELKQYAANIQKVMSQTGCSCADAEVRLRKLADSMTQVRK